MYDLNMLKKYVDLCMMRNSYLNALQTNYKIICEYNSLKKPLKKNLLFKIPIQILSLIALAFISYHSYIRITYRHVSSYSMSFEGKFMLYIVFFAATLGFLALSVFTVIKIILTIKNIIKFIKLKKKLPTASQNIKRYEEFNNQISKEIASYNILPVCYWHLANVIIQYIFNRRAYTIKEAINLYESEFRQDAQFRAQMDSMNRIYYELRNNNRINSAGMAMISSSIIFK